VLHLFEKLLLHVPHWSVQHHRVVLLGPIIRLLRILHDLVPSAVHETVQHVLRLRARLLGRMSQLLPRRLLHQLRLHVQQDYYHQVRNEGLIDKQQNERMNKRASATRSRSRGKSRSRNRSRKRYIVIVS